MTKILAHLLHRSGNDGEPSHRRSRARDGFALAPILYLIALAGIAGTVLFTGYTQILRSNVEITADNGVRNQIRMASEVLASRALINGNPPNLIPRSTIVWGTLDAARMPKNASGSSVVGSGDMIGDANDVGGLPTEGGVRALDPWGRYFIYCRWESPQSPGTGKSMSIISAGADGRLATTCADELPATGSDDRMEFLSVANVMSRAATWQSQGDNTFRFGVSGDPTAARVVVGLDNAASDTTRSLDIGGKGRFRGDLQVDGSLTVNGSATTLGNTNAGAMNVTSLTSNTTVAVGTNLTVAGNTMLTGAMTLGGAATMGSISAADITATSLNSSGTLDVAGATTLAGLTAGASTLGATTLASASVTGAASVAGLLTAGNGLSVTTIAAPGVAVTVNDNLIVSGDVTAAGGSFTNLVVTNPISGSVTGGAGSVPGTGITGVVPLASGGTGYAAASAADLLAYFGLTIGVNVQAWDADLDGLAALASTGFVRRTGGGGFNAGPIIPAEVPPFTGIGSLGGVPMPDTGQETFLLRGDATWINPNSIVGSAIEDGDSSVDVDDSGNMIKFIVNGSEQARIVGVATATDTVKVTGGKAGTPAMIEAVASSNGGPPSAKLIVNANLTGNATTATRLQTARTIGTSGDITATATAFDGSADITIPTTVARLQGVAVSSTTPTDGQVLMYNGAGSTWQPGSITGGTIDGGTIGAGSGTQLVLPNGTVGTPALRFLNNTNMGLYRPANNTMALVTSGVERLQINGAGEVGIGVAASTGKQLSVQSFGVNPTTTDTSLFIYRGIYAGSNNSNGSTGLTNVVNANVESGRTFNSLIGMFSSVVLDSGAGNVSTVRGIVLDYGIKTGATGAVTNATGIDVIPYHQAGTVTNSYGVYVRAPVAGGTVTNEYGFYSDSGTARNIFMGRVGIGTSSTSYALGLGGDSARTIGMERRTTADTAGNNLTLNAGAATSGATDKNGGDLLLASGVATGTGSSNIYFYTSGAGATGTTDRTLGTPKMTILGSGNVGIGTATPTAPLHVIGRPIFSNSSGNYTVGMYVDNPIASTTGFGTSIAFRGGSNVTFGAIGAATENGSNTSSSLVFQSYLNPSLNERMRIAGNGNVSIGTGAIGMTRLDVAGGIKIANEAATCPTVGAGAMRWDGTQFQGCDGTAWQNLTTLGGGAGNMISQLDSNVTVTDTGTDGSIAFTTDGVQRMVLTNTGVLTVTSSSATAFNVGRNGTTNPAFSVDASATSAATGLSVSAKAAGNGIWLNATSSNANDSIVFNSKGTGSQRFVISGGTKLLLNGSDTQFTHSPMGTVSATNRFSVTGAADSSLPTGTEYHSALFDFAQTRQHATGAIATQRDFRISPSTHSFVGASTITNAVGVYIDGPPIAGTNATFTNSHGLYVGTQNIGAGTTSGYGLTVYAPTGATNNYAASFMGGNVGIGTATPGTALTIANTDTSGGIQLFNRSSTAARYPAIQALNYDGAGFGGFPIVQLINARGSTSSPSPILTNDILGQLVFQGLGGTASGQTNQGGYIQVSAAEDYVYNANAGAYMRFAVTAVGSATPTERMRINSNGNISIGTGANGKTKLDVAGGIKIGDEAGLCTTVGAGAMRWNGTQFQGCDGTSWAGLTMLGGAANAISQLDSSVTVTDTGTNGTITFTTDGVARMAISNTGATTITSASASAFTVGANGATNPAFSVDASNATGVTGLAVVSRPSGNSVILGVTSSIVSESMVLQPKNTGSLVFSLQGNNRAIFSAVNTNLSYGAMGASTSTRFLVTGATDSGMLASTETHSAFFDFNQVRTHTVGAIATQRDFRISPSTHAFSGASTITNAVGLYVDGPPIAGTNASFTNSHGLYVGTQNIGAGVTNGYGLTAYAPTGASNNYAGIFMGGNVGVGVSNPSFKMDIDSTGNTSGMRLANYTGNAVVQMQTGGGGQPLLIWQNNSTLGANSLVGRFVFNTNVSGTIGDGAYISAIADAAPTTISTPMSILFSATPSGNTTPTERMRISGNGNVSIGTVAAGVTKLDVAGGVKIADEAATCASGLAGTVRYTSGNGIQLCHDAGSGYGWQTINISSTVGNPFYLTPDVSNFIYLGANGSDATAANRQYAKITADATTGVVSQMEFMTGGTSRLTINSVGRLFSTLSNGSDAQNLILRNTATTVGSTSGVNFENSNATGANINSELVTNNTEANLTFATRAGGVLAERLRISETGLSIGTKSLLYRVTMPGTTAQTVGMETNVAAAAGNNLTVLAGGAGAGTNLDGGTLVLSGGTATGAGISSVEFKAAGAGAGGGSASAAVTGLSLRGGTNGGTVPSVMIGPVNSGAGFGSKQTSGGNRYGLDFYTNFINRMSVDFSTGNVGIGTTSPGSKLHVYGAAGSYNTTAFILESAGADGFGTELQLKGAATAANWSIGTNKSISGGTADSLYFFKGSGTVGTKMAISDTGRVGIGQTAPATKLDVAGGVKIADETATCASGLEGTIRYTAAGGMQLCHSVASVYNWQTVNVTGATVANPLYFTEDASNNFAIGMNGSGTAAERQAFRANATTVTGVIQTIALATAGVDRMTISNTGNVGIGVAPMTGSGLLNVNGQIVGGNSNSGGIYAGLVTANRSASGYTAGVGAGLIFGLGTNGGAAIGTVNVALDGASISNSYMTLSTRTAGTLTERMRIASDGATTITNAAASAFAVGPTGATNPAFSVNASAASSATGVQVISDAAGSGVTLQTTSSGTDEPLIIRPKGSGRVTIGPAASGGSGVQIQNGNSNRLVIGAGQYLFTPAPLGTAATRFLYTGAVDTTLLASTEATTIHFDMAQNRQHAAGAIATQRDFRISPSTHSFTGASTITNAVGVYVDGPPIAGTNATFTNAHGLYVDTLNVGSGTTSAYGLTVNAPSGATNNYAAYFNGYVGIGTATPGSPLSVVTSGNSASSGRISIQNTLNGSNAAGAFAGINSAGLTASFGMASGGYSISTAIPGNSAFIETRNSNNGGISLVTANSANGAIRFYIGDTAADEKMRVANSGNIGIGTTGPATKLDVAGGVKIANEAATCAVGLAGTVRYTAAGGMELCHAVASVYGWQTVNVTGATVANPFYLTPDASNFIYLGANGSDATAANRQYMKVTADATTGVVSQIDLMTAGVAKLTMNNFGRLTSTLNSGSAASNIILSNTNNAIGSSSGFQFNNSNVTGGYIYSTLMASNTDVDMVFGARATGNIVEVLRLKGTGAVVTGTATVTSASTTALAVGANGATNPAFNVDASATSAATGITVQSAAAAGGVTLQATSSGSNETVILGSKGAGDVRLATNGSTRATISSSGVNFAPGASGSISPRFSYTAANADLGLNSGTEAPLVYFNMAQTRQHNTGALATQRDFRISPSTHSFVGASTITNAVGLYVDGPPIAGTNATFTNSHGLYVGTQNIGAGVTNGYGLTAYAPTGATNNYAAIFMDGNVGIGTATPTSELTVAGQITTTAGSGAGVTGLLIINTSPGVGSSTGIGFRSSSVVMGSINTGVALAGGNGTMTFTTRTGNSPSEKMRLAYTGNVSIGTAADGVTKLDVAGGVKIANEAATCASGLEGTIRYTAAGGMQLCHAVASVYNWQTVNVTGATVANPFYLTPDSGNLIVLGANGSDTTAVNRRYIGVTADATTGVVSNIAFTTNGAWRGGYDNNGLTVNGLLNVISNNASAFTVGANGTTNPAFSVDASVASAVTGVQVISNVTGTPVVLQATGSATNENIRIAGKGTGVVQLTANNGVRFTVTGPSYIFGPQPTGTAATTRFNYVSAADTNLTASTEAPNILFDLSATRTHVTGAIATQRDFRIAPSTHAFNGASTVTNAVGLYIDGPPIAGTNATFTNAHGLYVGTQDVGTGVGRAYGLTVYAPTGATTANNAAVFMDGNVGIGTTTPGNTLSVAGNISSSMTSGGLTENITMANTAATTGAGTRFVFRNGSVDMVYLTAQAAALGGNGRFTIVTRTANSPTEKFRIAQTGNVSIGTVADGVTMLDVAGGVKIANEAATCASGLEGTIRYTAAGGMELCHAVASVYGWRTVNVTGATVSNPFYLTPDVANTIYLGANGSDATAANRQYATITANATTGVVSNIALQTGGTNRLNIDSSGTVALPSASPGLMLYNTVDQTTNYERTRSYWVGNEFWLTNENGGTGISRGMRMSAGGIAFIISPGGYNLGSYNYKNVINSGSSNGASGLGLSATFAASNVVQNGLGIQPTINQSGTAGYNGLLINPTETSVGSGTKRLIDAQVGSVSKFSVGNDGATTITSAVASAFAVGANGVTNPAFSVDASTASGATGIKITSAATGSPVVLQATGSGTTESISVLSKSGGTAIFGAGSGAQLTMNGVGAVFNGFIPNQATTSRFQFTGAADTNLTAGNEATNVIFNMAQVRQHATGAIATQRDFRISPSTHSFVGASTITNAIGVYIDGPPVAGTNAALTNSHGLYIDTRNVGSGVTNGYGLTVNAPTGATNNYAAYFNGSVGIGTTAPTMQLDVIGAVRAQINQPSYSSALFVDNRGADDADRGASIAFRRGLSPVALALVGGYSEGAATTEGGLRFDTRLAGVTGERMRITSAGNVGIGVTTLTEKLEVAGNVKGTAFINSSDARLKDNIQTYQSGLDTVRKLRGVTFSWKKDGTPAVGLIAQEVEKVVPDVVRTGSDGFKSVAYANLVAPLIEAVKELAQKFDDLSAKVVALMTWQDKTDDRLKALEDKLQQLSTENARLKSQVKVQDAKQTRIEARLESKADKKAGIQKAGAKKPALAKPVTALPAAVSISQ